MGLLTGTATRISTGSRRGGSIAPSPHYLDAGGGRVVEASTARPFAVRGNRISDVEVGPPTGGPRTDIPIARRAVLWVQPFDVSSFGIGNGRVSGPAPSFSGSSLKSVGEIGRPSPREGTTVLASVKAPLAGSAAPLPSAGLDPGCAPWSSVGGRWANGASGGASGHRVNGSPRKSPPEGEPYTRTARC
jgi:hypothetical protein